MKHIHRDPEPPADNASNTLSAAPARRGTFCAYCGASIPKNGDACIVCGAKRGGEALIASRKSGGEEAWGTSLETPQAMRKNRRRLGAAVFLMILLFVMAGAGVAALEYNSYQLLLSQYTAQGAILYETAQNTPGSQGALKINMPLLQGPLVVTGNYDGETGELSAGTSYDSRFIAYLNNCSTTERRDRRGDLYLLDLVRLADDNGHEGLLLERAVVDFRFLPRSDRLLYLTETGELYLCDFSLLRDAFRVGSRTQETLLDTGVRGIGELSGRYLLYYKGERANASTWKESLVGENGKPFDLYLLQFAEPGAVPTLVGEGVSRVEDSMREYERIVFSKRTRSPPLAIYDVFVFHRRDGASRQIAKDARFVVSASASKAAVFCLSPSEETVSFKDIIEDDMLTYDQALSEPHLSDYVPEDASELQNLDPAVVDEIYERYDEAMAAYEEKLARDRLRQSLRAELRRFLQDNYLSFSLYYTDGETTLALADRIYNNAEASALAWANVEQGAFLYSRGERDVLGKLLLSELTPEEVRDMTERGFDVMRYLSENMPDILWYARIGEEAQEVFLESGTRHLERFHAVDSGAGIYFSSMPGYGAQSGTLYYTAVTDGKIGSVVHVDEDVTDYIGMAGPPNQGLVYRKLSRANAQLRDICVVNGGSTRVAASLSDPAEDVLLLGEDKGTLAYYRPQEGQSANQFYLFRDQERFIASAVSELMLYRPDFAYLLREGSGGKESLYLYRAGEITLLDESVGEALLLSAS